MESEDSGIFLFKNSKAKVVTETIFEDETTKPQPSNSVLKDFVTGKWMKTFLKKFLTPSLLHKPITAVSPEEIYTESKALPPFKSAKEEEPVLELPLKGKVRKVTRGNRRHKIKTRRLRNLKKK